MKNIDFELMIDETLDEFENDSKRERNLKTFVNFDRSVYGYNEKSMDMGQPKFKKKLNTSVYIKNNNNKNSLF